MSPWRTLDLSPEHAEAAVFARGRKIVSKFNLSSVVGFGVAICLAFGSSVLAQGTDGCDSVLRFTGREQEVLYSRQVRDAYSAWSHAHAANQGVQAGFPIDEVPIKLAATADDSSNDTGIIQSHQEDGFFNAVNKVFEPAVSAWKACKLAAVESIGLQAALTDGGRQLTVSVINKAGTPVVASPPQYAPQAISCATVGGAALKSGFLPDRPLVMSCRRKAGHSESQTVALPIGGKLYSISWPEIAGSPRSAALNQGTPQMVGGCNGSTFLSATPYNRTVTLGPVSMASQSGGTPAGLMISINGDVVTADNGATASGGSYVVPAFVPMLVRSVGAYTPGSCKTINATLWIP